MLRRSNLLVSSLKLLKRHALQNELADPLPPPM